MGHINNLFFSVGFVAMLTVPATAFANSTQVESSAFIPWKFVESLVSRRVNQSDKAASYVRDRFEFKVAGLNWVAKGVHIDLRTPRLDVPLNSLGGSASTDKLEILAQIESLNVDQIVERYISGVLVRVHYKFSCGPIALVQPMASAGVEFQHVLSGKNLDVEVAEPNLSWNPGSWMAAPFSCNGPSGVDEQVEQGLANALGNPQVLTPLLHEYLKAYVKEKIQKEYHKILEDFVHTDVASNTQFSILNVVGADAGIWIKILMSREHPSGEDQYVSQNLTEEELSGLPGDTPLHFISQDGVAALLQSELGKYPGYYRYLLNENSSFQELLKSRFLQFFVWPDLLNFSKKDPFYLDVFLPQKINLEFDSENRLVNRQNQGAVVQAWRDQKWWPYVFTSADAETVFEFNVADGQVRTTCHTEVENFRAQYGAEYRQAYPSAKSLPKSVMKKAMRNSVEQLCNLNMTWPTLGDARETFVLQSFKWRHLPRGHFLIMEWGQKLN